MRVNSSSITLEDLTRRTVRGWWSDGLWDFAAAGFMLLLAGWSYFLVRVIAFPTWTWPVQADEVVDPLHSEIKLWAVAIVPVGAAYIWGMYRVVHRLKSRWLASRQGDPRYPFWLKVAPQTYAAYVITYLALFVLAAALAGRVAGGPHWFSTACIAAPAAVLIVFGSVYSLPRYWLAGGLGGVICLALELLMTTSADYMAGPRGFFDVSPRWGNPALPLLIWAVVYLASGVIGLVSVLRQPELEPEP